MLFIIMVCLTLGLAGRRFGFETDTIGDSKN
jgi:hypothetical protein